MEVLSAIITNVLTALYQPFWFALLTAFFFMYFYLFATTEEKTGNGFMNAIKVWFIWFKKDNAFRLVFLLAFYTMLILARTLINRDMWLNPLEEVLGSWGIYKRNLATGEMVFTTEAIENIILFSPFSYLFMLVKSNIEQSNPKLIRSMILSTMRIVTIFSFVIEFLQLFLRVGSFQLSDLFYNFVGGLLGIIGFYALSFF